MKYLLVSAFFGICFLIDLMPQKAIQPSVLVQSQIDTLPKLIESQNAKIKRFEVLRFKRDTIIDMKFSEAEAMLKNGL